jgi:hypothetical protein
VTAATYQYVDLLDASVVTTRALLTARENITDTVAARAITADLPDMVKVCLYVLTSRLGTGRLIDTRAVRCSLQELATETGLDVQAASLCLYLAQAHGWVTAFHNDEARLAVPGEDISMYQGLLDQEAKPIAALEAYEPLRAKVTAQAAKEQAEREARHQLLRERLGSPESDDTGERAGAASRLTGT